MSTVLVTSGGGHLQEMRALLPRMGISEEVVWAAPASGLSESALQGCKHLVLPYLPQRDWRGALRMTRFARSRLVEIGAERIISTGASPAPPFFLAGAALGIELHYIESATRSLGPSLSGRLIAALPQANLYTQYPSWSSARWAYVGSIFDPYRFVPAPPPVEPIRRVVVTLGTEQFGFRRMVERLVELLPKDAEVLWQTGATDVSGLGLTSHVALPSHELVEAIRAADVVISHAGVGSALTAFDLGKRPVLIPRDPRFREHIDNHQLRAAQELGRRQLAVTATAESLTYGHLEEARRGVVINDGDVGAFSLRTSPGRVAERVGALGLPVVAVHDEVSAGFDREDAEPRNDERRLSEALTDASRGAAPTAKATLRSITASATATPTTRARALDSLVDLLRQDGNYAECSDLLRERLTLPYESTAPRVHSQMQLARFLMESGQLTAAIDSANGSVAEAVQSGVAATLEGVKLRATLAELLRLRGDLIAAELHIGLALVAADRLGDSAARGSAAWNAALLSADQGWYEDALGWAQKAGAIFREDAAHLSAALVGVVEVMIQLDSPAAGAHASLGQLEEDLAIIREQGTASQQGFVFIQMARLHLRRGDTDHAQTHIQMALAQLGDANVIDTATALSVKAQILAMAGDHLAAREVATTAASTLARVGAQRLAESVWADLADIPRMADYVPGVDDSPAGGVVVPRSRMAASARRAFGIPGAPL